jgi:hypothetical protein
LINYNCNRLHHKLGKCNISKMALLYKTYSIAFAA